MDNRLRCANFNGNLFSSNEIISILGPPLFRKRPKISEKLSSFILIKTMTINLI